MCAFDSASDTASVLFANSKRSRKRRKVEKSLAGVGAVGDELLSWGLGFTGCVCLLSFLLILEHGRSKHLARLLLSAFSGMGISWGISRVLPIGTIPPRDPFSVFCLCLSLFPQFFFISLCSLSWISFGTLLLFVVCGRRARGKTAHRELALLFQDWRLVNVL